MRSAVFDVEATALEGVGAGIVLCACIRPWDTKRTRDFRIKYLRDWDSGEHGFLEREEIALLKEICEELAKYDLLIGQNIEQAVG